VKRFHLLPVTVPVADWREFRPVRRPVSCARPMGTRGRRVFTWVLKTTAARRPQKRIKCDVQILHITRY